MDYNSDDSQFQDLESEEEKSIFPNQAKFTPSINTFSFMNKLISDKNIEKFHYKIDDFDIIGKNCSDSEEENEKSHFDSKSELKMKQYMLNIPNFTKKNNENQVQSRSNLQKSQPEDAYKYKAPENIAKQGIYKHFIISRNEPKNTKKPEIQKFYPKTVQRDAFNKNTACEPEMKYRQTSYKTNSGQPLGLPKEKYLPPMTSVMEKTKEITYNRNRNVLNMSNRGYEKNISLMNSIPTYRSAPTLNPMRQIGTVNSISQMPSLNQMVIKSMNVPNGITYVTSASPQTSLPQMNQLVPINRTKDIFRQSHNNLMPIQKNNIILTVRPLNIVSMMNQGDNKKYYVKTGNSPNVVQIPVSSQQLNQISHTTVYPMNMRQQNQFRNYNQW